MEPLEYCRSKAAPEGSSLYYALLFTPATARPGLTALAAYRAEILEIPIEVSDNGVGAVKLQWWKEELERLRNGAPRHPISRALHQAIPTSVLATDALDQVIEAAQMDLEYGRYPSLQALTLYCHRAGATTAQLSWPLLSDNAATAAPFAHDLSMALELTRILRRLPQDIQRGRIYIPEDDIEAAGLDPNQLLTTPNDPRLTQLIKQQGDRAADFLNSAIQRLPLAMRAEMRPGLILAVLHRELLKVIAEDQHAVMTRAHHLTPLRKLWLAWKTARRPSKVRPWPQESNP